MGIYLSLLLVAGGVMPAVGIVILIVGGCPPPPPAIVDSSHCRSRSQADVPSAAVSAAAQIPLDLAVP